MALACAHEAVPYKKMECQREAPKDECPREFAFRICQRHRDVGGPPFAGSTQQRHIIPSNFRKFFERGDLPIKVEDGRRISWKIEIERLDYHHYLPLLFDGMVELEHPYELVARRGCFEMIEHTDGCKILPVIPQLILPIKNALCTRNLQTISIILKLIQRMIFCEEKVGLALVPYYRQILPVFNIFKQKNVNLGDGIEYSQRKQMNVADLITETLEILERTGGEDAYINIKYMIPTYESCLLN